MPSETETAAQRPGVLDGAAPASGQARPPLIRDRIMAFLTEPRKVVEVAAHIDRRTCVATGHLRAMAALGLVVRIDWGVHVRMDSLRGLAVPSTIERGATEIAHVVGHARDPTSFQDLQDRTGRSREALLATIRRIRRKGTSFPQHLCSARKQKQPGG